MHVLAKHVADGDPLSYYLSLDKGGEVVVDLGCAAVIDCLEYMPRNDDNFISPGDTYELFCHAGTEGWKSLGKQRADTTCLDWIVPDNACSERAYIVTQSIKKLKKDEKEWALNPQGF